MLLLKVETTSLPGDNQTGDPQTLNPVVVCTTCGTLMARVGGAAGGWLTHVPQLGFTLNLDVGILACLLAVYSGFGLHKCQ